MGETKSSALIMFCSRYLLGREFSMSLESAGEIFGFSVTVWESLACRWHFKMHNCLETGKKTKTRTEPLWLWSPPTFKDLEGKETYTKPG